jgi:predicted  nucleic acid-binding Zn-ribbon protein
MKIRKKGGIGILRDSEGREQVSYCPRCLEKGFHEPLGKRIYKEGEAYREGDEEKFRQCRACGLIVPSYETKKESVIKDRVDSGDNPFNTPKIVGVHNKDPKSRSERQHERLLEDIDNEIDPDIRRERLKGNQVTVHYDDTDIIKSQERYSSPEHNTRKLRSELRRVDDID